MWHIVGKETLDIWRTILPYVLNIMTLITKVEPGHVSIACTSPPCSCLLTERRKKWGKYSAKVFCERGERERGIPSQAPFILSRIFEKLA
jgi:hypothetical protein